MPRKQAETTDSIVFNGVKFRRYPMSSRLSDRMYFRADGRLRREGISYLHHAVWEFYHGEIPDGYQVHHKDGNTLNNDIKNLVLLPAAEHLSYHARERYKDPKQRAKNAEHLKAMREQAKAWHASEEGRFWHSEHAKQCAQKQRERPKIKKRCMVCGEVYEISPAMAYKSKFCSKKCYAKYRRDSGVDDETRRCIVCGKLYRCNKYSKIRTCGRTCAARGVGRKRGAGGCV